MTTVIVLAAVFTQPVYVHSPPDSVGWALVDCETLPEAERLVTRYLYIPHYAERPADWARAASFVCNSIGFQRYHYRPELAAREWLLRLNFSELFPDPARLTRALAIWERLAVRGTRFHILDAEAPLAKRSPIANPVLIGQDENLSGLWVRLKAATGTTVPIVGVDTFVAWSLDQFDDGLYYSWVLPKGMTTEADIFGHFAGVPLSRIQELRGLGRAVVQSEVTGKWRRIDAGTGPGVNAVGVRWARTIDIADEDLRGRAKFNALLSPVVQNARAKEILFFDGIRMTSVLIDAGGRIQDEAPPDIVADPHTGTKTKRLQAGLISCIRCHGPAHGWQPFTNVLDRGLRGGMNIYDDLRLDPVTAQDTIVGLYTQQLDDSEGFFGRARRDYTYAVKQQSSLTVERDGRVATLPGVTVPEIAAIVSRVYASYRYDMVTPQRAALDLGWQVSVEDAPSLLRQLFADAAQTEGVTHIHPFLTLLKNGIANLYPDDWRKVYAEAQVLSHDNKATIVEAVQSE